MLAAFSVTGNFFGGRNQNIKAATKYLFSDSTNGTVLDEKLTRLDCGGLNAAGDYASVQHSVGWG
jgi:hypothetical protein